MDGMSIIHAGDTIGKYEIVLKLGFCGMSTMWLATDPIRNKVWALKEIRKDTGPQQCRASFERSRDDALFMLSLNHPALPRVSEIIEDRDALFVVMEYVPGRCLADILKQCGEAFEEDVVVGWGIQLCDALGYLHTLDPPIVYRDMKPGNLFLADDGPLRLLDFGLAVEAGDRKDTVPAGTPGYMCPEALSKGAWINAQFDIYGLGATMFCLVTNRNPRECANGFALPSIREIDPTLSKGLDYVIAKATQPNPSDRYRTCSEMQYDLEHLEGLAKNSGAKAAGRLQRLTGQLTSVFKRNSLG